MGGRSNALLSLGEIQKWLAYSLFSVINPNHTLFSHLFQLQQILMTVNQSHHLKAKPPASG